VAKNRKTAMEKAMEKPDRRCSENCMRKVSANLIFSLTDDPNISLKNALK